MSSYVFDPRPPVAVPTTDGHLYPVRRIFLIGKNYADHVREMGDDPAKTPPVFFTKPADAVIAPTEEAPDVPFAPATDDLHYEGELVLALKEGGRNIPAEDAEAKIYGAALGCDLTRRDLQKAARDKGGPWDMAKGFDHSAVIGPILPGAHLNDAIRLALSVNGDERQGAALRSMIWSPAAIIAKLSTLVELQAGDLVYTGTPEGVGPLQRGDQVTVTADGLPPLHFTMAED